MKVKIKALDYMDGIAEEKEVEIDDYSVIFVEVVTGDEIVRVFNAKTKDITCISAGGRSEDYYDGEYVVPVADIKKWCERESVYGYLYHGNSNSDSK